VGRDGRAERRDAAGGPRGEEPHHPSRQRREQDRAERRFGRLLPMERSWAERAHINAEPDRCRF
jgi:hypothetical protein